MNELRQLAQQIDQHMQQLAHEGVGQAHDIIQRMVGLMPNLHKIWHGVSDAQMAALAGEFPNFNRYARLVREAYDTAQQDADKPRDSISGLSEELRQFASELLSMGSALERSFAVLRGMGEWKILQSELDELHAQRQEWLMLLNDLKTSLHASDAAPTALAALDALLAPMAERVTQLAD